MRTEQDVKTDPKPGDVIQKRLSNGVGLMVRRKVDARYGRSVVYNGSRMCERETWERWVRDAEVVKIGGSE
jgi:hypothetical protein